MQVQIRSLLQQSWAEIEHDLGYKGAKTITAAAKRTSYRVAALLEQSDIEFNKLRKELNTHEKEIITEMKSNPAEVPLDFSSMKSFCLNSPDVVRIEKTIGDFIVFQNFDDLYINMLEKAQNAGFKNIAEIEVLYKENEAKILEYGKVHKKPNVKYLRGTTVNWVLRNFERSNKTL